MSESLKINTIEALTLMSLKVLAPSDLSPDKIVKNYFDAYQKISEEYWKKQEEIDKENDSHFEEELKSLSF